MEFNKPDIAAKSVFHDLSSLNQLRESAKTDQRETLRAAVKEFEAYFLNLMLKNMRSANKLIGEDSPLTNDDVSFYNEMHDQQLAVELSRSSKFGIGDMLFNQLAAALPNDSSKDGQSENNQNFSIKDYIRTRSNTNEQSSLLNSTSKSAADELANTKFDYQPKTNFVIDNKSKTTTANIDFLKHLDLKVFGPGDNSNNNVNPMQSAAPADSKFETKKDFIERLVPLAKKAASKIGVHPGVLIAQAALETGWGKFLSKAEDGSSSLNLFGIKSNAQWDGKVSRTMTIEFVKGLPEKLKQTFKAYDSLEQSFTDYVDLITENPRYQKAVESSSDPKAYLENIQTSGYATDPNYAEKIHGIFVRESLFQLTD
ncbi:MAG: flagellar assembly peptidoglycan hydrolase FlgJ [Gammaproteobacteria bacterium]|nr:flagellar assembly peptidoglycan hydrolase FlgJ [Gammaproteobacteria bacterium]